MSHLNDFNATLAQQVFEQRFQEFIGQRYGNGNVTDNPADRLAAACSYALRGEGKRVRPVFCLLFTAALGGRIEDAIPAACALELIHTYSLVHDDLPLLDNDDLRRGRPTTHVVFDPATALLAGDALLTDAFALLCAPKDFPHAQLSALQRVEMVATLATASGSRGMVDGQMRDVQWTGRKGATKDDLDTIHLRKTGALLAASCQLGAIAGQGTARLQRQAYRFGELIGLTFQIVDDLMDVMPNIGKSSGKDHDQGKLTYLSSLPVEAARQRAADLTDEANSLFPNENFTQVLAFAKTLLQRSK